MEKTVIDEIIEAKLLKKLSYETELSHDEIAERMPIIFATYSFK